MALAAAQVRNRLPCQGGQGTQQQQPHLPQLQHLHPPQRLGYPAWSMAGRVRNRDSVSKSSIGLGQLSFSWFSNQSLPRMGKKMETLQESDEPSSTEGGVLSLRHRPVHSRGKRLTPVANGFQRNIYTKKESGIPFAYAYYQRVILRSEHF